jgi:hypothetical protein
MAAERGGMLRFSALVIPKQPMFERSHKGRPALGGDPEQGGWRRINPPLAGTGRSVA